MIRPIHKLFVLIWGVLFLLLSCPSPVKSLDEEDYVPEFNAFYLSPSINGSISDVVIGDIDEDSVVLVVPGSGSSNTWFCPSFDTDAATVMVGNQEQRSGESWLDFSDPVEYTLISAGGISSTVTVEIIFSGIWQYSYMLGGAQSPQLGIINGMYPYFVYESGLMGGYYYDSLNSYWDYLDTSYYTFGSGSYPYLGAAEYGNTVFVIAYESASMWLEPYSWSYGLWSSSWGSYGLSGSISDINVYTRDSYQPYISYINTADNSYPEMVFFNTGSDNNGRLMGYAPIEYRSATSLMASVSYSGIYAATTYQDDSDTIYLYRFDEGYEYWYSETTLAVSGALVEGLFYDQEDNSLELAVSVQNSDDPSKTDLTFYRFEFNSYSWEHQPYDLTLSVVQGSEIQIVQGEDSFLVATDQYCYELIQDYWVELGGGPYISTPALSFSVSYGENNRIYVGYETASDLYIYYLER